MWKLSLIHQSTYRERGERQTRQVATRKFVLRCLFLALRVLDDILGNAALRCDKRQRERPRTGGERVKNRGGGETDGWREIGEELRGEGESGERESGERERETKRERERESESERERERERDWQSEW